MILLAAATGVAAANPPTGDDPSDPVADEQCYRIMRLLGARPVECPTAELPPWPHDRVVFCGSTALGAKAIRKTIEGELGFCVALERSRAMQRWIHQHGGLYWDLFLFP